MSTSFPPGLFITGTNTEVGKTYVTALIARSLVAAGKKVGVYKPAASGCRLEGGVLVSDDAVALWESADKPLTLADVCPQCFEMPLAPHLAARAEGKEIDTELLRSGAEVWHGHCDILLIEGAGGLMSPMSDELYVADLAEDFGYPLIVVAPNTLGVINQTLQTLITAAAYADGLEVAGVVLNDVQPTDTNDPSTASNFNELTGRCVPPILAHVGWQDETFSDDVDWSALASA